jgi:polyphosphate kinase
MVVSTNILSQAEPLVKDDLDTPLDLDDPRCYFNRELSLLEFQRRVLEEACDPRHPLLTQVKFAAIFGSNLDEFFMTRVAGLKQQVNAGVTETPPDGLTPSEQLAAIRKRVRPMFRQLRKHLQDYVFPSLKEKGVVVLNFDELSEKQRNQANEIFVKEVFPVLTPLAFDPGRPFPHISNLSLNLAVHVYSEARGESFARLKVPTTLSRLLQVSVSGGKKSPKRYSFVWLEQVIMANLHLLFPGIEILEAYPFRVTRDADIEIQEDEASDLLKTIQAGLRRRQFGRVVRLTVDEAMPNHIRELLIYNLEINPESVFHIQGALGLRDLMVLHEIDRPDLKDPPFVPVVPPRLRDHPLTQDFFEMIKQQDVLLHHPYDSFIPVIDFLKAAARDEKVLAIKQTLYRVGRDSPIVNALMEARENGKEVAVLVELKARFDEESNISWARALERVGVHVVYGLLGLKTHSKITLVVRREADGLRRYLHLATGNYNAVTAQIYTDLGLLTCDETLGTDASQLFNFLTGYSDQAEYQELIVAPVNLREKFTSLIEREIEQHSSKNPGHLIFKMNSLVDSRMIRVLYRASQAGVKVDLLVRGICCLRPGVKGLSENIRVVSVVGRFLEHTRIFYFRNRGKEEIYLGSADLMPRNLNWRVETAFPIKDQRLLVKIRDQILKICLRDNVQARVLLPDGTYERIKAMNGAEPFDSQEEFLRIAQSNYAEF